MAPPQTGNSIYMDANPKIVLTGHTCVVVPSGIPDFTLPAHYLAWPVNHRHLLLSNRFSTPSVMLCKDLHYRFESTKRHSEDYLLWLQIVLSGQVAWRLELPLTYLYKARFGERGLSAELWKMEKGELDTYRRLLATGLIHRSSCLALYSYSILKFLRRTFVAWKKSRLL